MLIGEQVASFNNHPQVIVRLKTQRHVRDQHKRNLQLTKGRLDCEIDCPQKKVSWR